MSLTSLSASLALCLSAGLWLVQPPVPQPAPVHEPLAPVPPPVPPSVFDCRCECPAPTPCQTCGAAPTCSCPEPVSCSWIPSIIAFFGGCLITVLFFCVYGCVRRACSVEAPVFVHSSQRSLRVRPKAVTPSQRRLALGDF